jgi:threonine/homoserine/homoserine lactone efflux protein
MEIIMIRKGFRVGILLQFAVGPICFFIFQTSAAYGILPAITGVLAVTLVDGLYILAAILGVGILLEKYTNIQRLLKLFSVIVLILFGISYITDVLNLQLLPHITFTSVNKMDNLFIKALLLTLSNPLTILFWAGIFTAKMSEVTEGINRNTKSALYFFGFGAVLSTFFFLSFISLLGSLFHKFLPDSIINGLNVIVGILLIYFGIHIFQKDKTAVN